MARYYDLDKLSKLIEVKADTMLEGKGAMLYVAKWLNLLPTADVVEVKHGKWIRTGWNSYKCSNCGGMFVGMAARDWNGCPNCLAKMDGTQQKEG